MEEPLKDPSKVSKVKIIPINGMGLPAVSLGTSPFIGAGQFKDRASAYRRLFFENPSNMVKLMVYAAELGVPCVQLLAVDRIIAAFIVSKRQSGIDLACTLTVGFGDREWELKQASKIRPRVVFLHGMITDRLDLKDIEGWLKDIKDLDLVPGCATHAPARSIPELLRAGLDIGAYMVPFNRVGAFMGCRPEDLLKTLDSIECPVIAKKTLAAGKLSPEDGLPYIARQKQIDGLTIGITSSEEMKETLSIAISNWPL